MSKQTIGAHLLWTDEMEPSSGKIVHEPTFLGVVLLTIVLGVAILGLAYLWFVAFPQPLG